MGKLREPLDTQLINAKKELTIYKASPEMGRKAQEPAEAELIGRT